MGQNQLFAVRIAEGDVPEFDIPPEPLPVLLLRVEGIPVFLHHLRRIGDIGGFLHQSGKALDIDLGADQLGQGRDHIAQRVHHAQRIGHKDRQGADLHHTLPCKPSAPPENDGQGRGGHGGQCGRKQGGIMGGVDRCLPHPLRILPEIPDNPVLHHQCADGPGPGDTLVEIPGNPGIQLPDLPVQHHQPSLEKPCQQDGYGQKQKKHRRKLGVNPEHDEKHADDVGKVPYQVHEPPGDQRSDAVRIAHDPGVEVSHAVVVVIGK